MERQKSVHDSVNYSSYLDKSLDHDVVASYLDKSIDHDDVASYLDNSTEHDDVIGRGNNAQICPISLPLS